MNPGSVLNRPSAVETSRVSKSAAPSPAERTPRGVRTDATRPKKFDHALDRARRPAEKSETAKVAEKPVDEAKKTDAEAADPAEAVNEADESRPAEAAPEPAVSVAEEEIDEVAPEASDAAIDTALPLPAVVQAVEAEDGSAGQDEKPAEKKVAPDDDAALATATLNPDAINVPAVTLDDAAKLDVDAVTADDAAIAPSAGVKITTAGQTPDATASASPADAPAAETRPATEPAAKPHAEQPDAAAPAPLPETQSEPVPETKSHHAPAPDAASQFAGVLDSFASAPAAKSDAPASAVALNIPPEQRFAADNVDKIVTSVRTEIMPKGGGSMQLRLDPPEMGALSVTVKMDDGGLLTASFQTSNDEATRLLSHSLGQLKHALETAGVSVDKINVKQAAPAENASNQDGRDQQQSNQNPHDHPARQEQQRREMLQRMWRKLSLGADPLDTLA